MQTIEQKKQLPEWKRAVIKVGSALITADSGGCRTRYLLSIANFINACFHQGKEIILVSSGAVAAGRIRQAEGQRNLPISIQKKQAFSAIGQSIMMQTWSKLFDFPCGQILLTQEDFNNRSRYVNAKNTLMELLKLKALPVVNENDSIGTEELKVGDNDNIAAHVADLVEAELLIICSDVDGLYNKDPRVHKEARFIPWVETITPEIYSHACGTKNRNASGGMTTKIEAADKATQRGVNTIIMNGKFHENFTQLLDGEVCGTLFERKQNRQASKKHWLMHTLRGEGTIVVDEGAAEALLNRSASLLPSGISGVQGNFLHGDPVNIDCLKQDKQYRIAKGLSQYCSRDLEKIMGRHSKEIPEILGYHPNPSAVHRDDLVLI